MSLPILQDLHDDLKRLMIAGSDLAAGDMSLKKKVPVLMKLGEKSAVFGRLAMLTESLTDGGDSSNQLLELAELLTSVMYTMGKTGVDGDLVTTGTVHEFPTNIGYQKLKPILEALTTKGSSRSEVIEQAYQSGSLNDLRLIQPLISALGDSNLQLADFISEKVLPDFGMAVLPMVQSTFSIKGKKADGRRLRVISGILKEEGLPFYIECVEKGSEQVRIAALEILYLYDAAEELLLEYAMAKKPDTRRAAFESLVKRDSAKAVQFLLKALEGRDHDTVIHLARFGSDRLKESLLGYAKGLLNDFLETKEEEKVKRLHAVLFCFRPVPNLETGQFLQEIIENRDIPSSLARVAAVSLLNEGGFETLEFVEKVHQIPRLAGLADLSLQASLYIRSKEEVFDHFSRYAKRSRKDPGGNAILATMDNFIYFIPELRGYDERFLKNQYAGYGDKPVTEHRLVGKEWDERWVDVLMELDEEQLVFRLPKRVMSQKHLQYLLDKLAINPYFSSKRGTGVMVSLIQIGYEKVFDVLMDVLKKTDVNMKSVQFHHGWIITNLGMLCALPKKYAEEIRRIAENEIDNDRIKSRLQEIVYYLNHKGEI
ncbi:HEAT repeat domain-containing protein [Neobacillus sp. SAB-20_R2A]|uniref:HEAT repeat domain-containing protein n=1 Tax=Neobacillus sp. SAB-20_R2A TaxID=3120519 RepID=UPI003C6DFE68